MTVAFCNKHYQIYKTLVNQQFLKHQQLLAFLQLQRHQEITLYLHRDVWNLMSLSHQLHVWQPDAHIIVYLILTLANSGVGKVDKSVLTWPPVLLAARRFVTWTCSCKEHWMVRIWTFYQQALMRFFLSKHNILCNIVICLIVGWTHFSWSRYFINFDISSFSSSIWLIKQCDCQS